MGDPGDGDGLAPGPVARAARDRIAAGPVLEFRRASWRWSWSWRARWSWRDWIKERREAGRPLPPADSPNVLLIVMDTVRADHLSLYGYHRATTPEAGAVGEAGDSLREGARHRALDPRLAREPVHGPLAPRARRGMADPARAARFPDPGRISGVSRLRDRGLRRQYPLLLV